MSLKNERVAELQTQAHKAKVAGASPAALAFLTGNTV
jgi:hypothetical protein